MNQPCISTPSNWSPLIHWCSINRLEEYLTAYLDDAGLRGDPKGPLFRTIGQDHRPAHPLSTAAGERLCDDPPHVLRRPGIATKLGNHSFRATGITAYLKNGGTLEKAAAMANHASTRTTQLYDRRQRTMLDEDERIVI